MKKRSVLIPILLAILLMVALSAAALAGPLSDTVIEANEVVNNDVVVFDGDLEIEPGAVVNGDVAVFNGDATIHGQVNGDLTLFNGDLVAGADAFISGECVLLNGEASGDGAGGRSFGNCTAIQNLELPPLAELGPWFRDFQTRPDLELPGQIAPIPTVPAPAMPDTPAMPKVPAMPAIPVVPPMPHQHYDRGGGFFGRLLAVVSSSLLFGFLGLLTGAVMPNQLRRITDAAREKSLVSGMAGALTAVAVPSLIVLLIPVSIILTFVCIGLLGFPLMFLLGLALVVGGFLGWIAVGTWLGMRVFGRGKGGERIARSAALGTALLTFITGIVGLITFGIGGALLALIVSWIGLGAVALTQFGLKPYPRRPQAGPPGDGLDADKVDAVLGTLPPEAA